MPEEGSQKTKGWNLGRIDTKRHKQRYKDLFPRMEQKVIKHFGHKEYLWKKLTLRKVLSVVREVQCISCKFESTSRDTVKLFSALSVAMEGGTLRIWGKPIFYIKC